MKRRRRETDSFYKRFRTPPLSREEERSLLVRAQAGDTGARDRLVRANLGLVYLAARRWRIGTVPLDDVIQEGMMGLIHAIGEFDVSRDTGLAAYAKWWIRARIGLYMSGARSVVRPPHNTVAPQDASLDGPPEFSDGEGGGDTWAETLEDETDSPETLALGRVQDAQVREAVNYFRYRLRPMEFDIAASRFRGDYSDGLEAVGGRHGVSGERIRKLEPRVRKLLTKRLERMGFGRDA